jgi:ketol-acid reductoisomerase
MNYFNTLPLRLQLEQLGKCRFMDRSEFSDGVEKLRGKKVVIVGCGAQGLNQGLNMRDSGLDVSYALRDAAITEQRPLLEETLPRTVLLWALTANSSLALIWY